MSARSRLIFAAQLATLMVLFAARQAVATEQRFVAWGGLNHYGLNEIADAETTYRGFALEPGTFGSGGSFGAAADIDLSPAWSVGFGYERLHANTQGTSDTGQLDVNLQVHLLKVVVTTRPWRSDRAALSVGIAGGLGIVRGELQIQHDNGLDSEGEPTGTGFLLEAVVGGEYEVLSGLRLFVATGARLMTVDEVVAGAAPLRRDDDHSDVAFDFGGAFARAGLTIALPTGSGGI